MNPFTDPKLSFDLYSPASRVDGRLAARIARTTSSAFGDPFTEIEHPKSPGRGTPLESPSQIEEVFEETRRVFMTSASRNVVLKVSRFVGRFTCHDVPTVEVDFYCLYEEPLISNAERCFACLAELTDPFWGLVDTAPAVRAIFGAPRRDPRVPEPPPFGLPRSTALKDLSDTIEPGRISWINYWSPATCDLLGFPDPARDAELLSRSRRLATGGWVVKLTDDPLDPAARPEHLRALVDAYARFPAIGRR